MPDPAVHDSARGSVTRLLGWVLRGSHSALNRLLKRLHPDAARCAQQRLGPKQAHVLNADELANDALHSLARYLNKPRLTSEGFEDRDALLRLLGTITQQKIAHAWRDATRLKRDARRCAREADLPTDGDGESPLAQLSGREPSPEWTADFQDTLDDYLHELRPALRAVVELCLEGYTRREIADRLGRSLRAVERELQEVRAILRERLLPPPNEAGGP